MRSSFKRPDLFGIIFLLLFLLAAGAFFLDKPGIGAIAVALAFLLAIGLFIFIVISGLIQWNRNNHAPQWTVGAVVTGKHADAFRRHHGTGNRADTWYYATFLVEGGEQRKFQVSMGEYIRLNEGDRGYLTGQGTRYIGFERI